ncbi:hypothetical protein B0H13DRAFT_1936443 [Mycena leptocephala]|nr:hypothetical protein B0H13DRAFT_1936443 [Mycena leptocephala]
MSEELRAATGRERRLNIARVDPEDEFSLDWIGINKNCSSQERSRTFPPTGVGVLSRLVPAGDSLEGWIPLAKENDRKEGAWAMDPDLLLPLAGPTHQGLWHLSEGSRAMVRTSLTFWRSLLEDVCGSALFDEDTHIPPLFDVERLELEYGAEMDVHWMVMDAKRAILDCGVGWIGGSSP